MVLLEPGNRVMLLRYDENGAFRAIPAARSNPVRPTRSARPRELRKELGIRHVALGPHLATRVKDHPVVGCPVRQAKRYYLASVPAEAILPGTATQADNIRKPRWWTSPRCRAPARSPAWPGRAPALANPRRRMAGGARHTGMGISPAAGSLPEPHAGLPSAGLS